MRKLVLFGVVGVALAGCCGDHLPSLSVGDPVVLREVTTQVDLAELTSSARGAVTYSVSAPDGLLAEVNGSMLSITRQPGWQGEAELLVGIEDRCGDGGMTPLVVLSEGFEPGSGCPVTLTYRSAGSPAGVSVAGSFNDFDAAVNPLAQQADGAFAVTLNLPPGAYPYKLVELQNGGFGEAEAWLCDPTAPFIQCDHGYKEPWDTNWSQRCSPGVESCNSLLVVDRCDVPQLRVTELDVDRSAGRVRATVAQVGGAAVSAASAFIDGAPISGGWDGAQFVVDLPALTPGRHVLRFEASGGVGDAEPVVVPFWTDDFDWRQGVVYFAFVDRVANGDTSNDNSEGATAFTGGYMGGDFQGLTNLLPYLDDLGVTVLWLSNPQENTSGAWAGDCNLTYAAYHAYWPSHPTDVEANFGGEAALRTLVDQAHERGMRVIMDWVGNHVHETHPWATEHPTWFNQQEGCKDSANGQINFDRIPETCWFAPYLPDLDFTQPQVLDIMVRDGIDWAQRFDMDGFRVDAVKHMPHAITYNLNSAIRAQIEHEHAGGDEVFWTIGETFDGAERIKAYIGDDQLRGQFDFPLYYAVRDTFAYGSMDLPGLLGAWSYSEGFFGADPIMSTFLGNHDVPRFTTEAAGQGRGVCEGESVAVAPEVSDPYVHESLRLAWTFLFTLPPPPLVYYGDEVGLAGYNDPDNRQPLWWAIGEIGNGEVQTVDDLVGRTHDQAVWTARHVRDLGRARRDYRAMWDGPLVEWWSEADLYAYARVAPDGSEALVILNRSGVSRTLDNGLSFAGLTAGATFTDALGGQTFTAQGDRLIVDVPARGSRVLLRR